MIEEIEKEHEDIERELIELESISSSENINYSNLIHVFTNLISIWDKHEIKENKIFPYLRKHNKLVIPIDQMMFQHKELGNLKNHIIQSLKRGDESEIKKSLNNYGKQIIHKLRKHIDDEDNLLYTIASSELPESDKKHISKLFNSTM